LVPVDPQSIRFPAFTHKFRETEKRNMSSLCTFLLLALLGSAKAAGVLFRPGSRLVEASRDTSQFTSGGRTVDRSSTTDSTGGCTFLTFAGDCNVPGTRFEDGSETRVS
jgi:hypothetical protein